VEVTERPWEHDKAITQTRQLMADPGICAIYETAFEYNSVRVRVDILERTSLDSWGIREVKSAGSIRTKTKEKALLEKYVRDLALQEYVLSSSGLEISSIKLIYVNSSYSGLEKKIEVADFFVMEEVQQDILRLASNVESEVNEFLGVLQLTQAPCSEPSKSKCSAVQGAYCPYWATCTAVKPVDWIGILYSLNKEQLANLCNKGVSRISNMTREDKVNDIQSRMLKSVVSRTDIVGSNLADRLSAISLPAIHLDFEY